MQNSLGGYPFRFIILEFFMIPLAICDFRIYFTQKSLGRQPLGSIILVFEIHKILG